jgi:hypothetical protein
MQDGDEATSNSGEQTFNSKSGSSPLPIIVTFPVNILLIQNGIGPLSDQLALRATGLRAAEDEDDRFPFITKPVCSLVMRK